jgi:hypothetical protein
MMTGYDLYTATFLRILTSLFGEDQVVVGMSLFVVCGGVMPLDFVDDHIEVAKNRKCLFTIVNQDDRPCLVIDFAPGRYSTIDMGTFEYAEQMERALTEVGVKYISIDVCELTALQDPHSNLDLCTLLSEKVGSLIEAK